MIHPWKKERVPVDFHRRGCVCVVLRHSTMGHLIGAVGVPDCAHGLDELHLTAHGELTFYPPDRSWSPAKELGLHQEGMSWVAFHGHNDGDYAPFCDGVQGELVYRDLEYMLQHVRSLADQLASASRDALNSLREGGW